MDQWLPGVCVTKGPEGSFEGDENVLYLDGAGSYVYQNTLNYTIKMIYFTECKLYLNQVDFFKWPSDLTLYCCTAS